MKPIIKYRGGKSKELKNFLQFIPHDYNRYVEPFAGGAALYFYLEPQLALLNDINTKLINFYLAVKNNYDQLKKELGNLENINHSNQVECEELKESGVVSGFIENKNEALYYLLRDMYNGKIEKKYLDATLYYFINKTSYSGMLRFNSKGEFNVPFGRYKNFNTEMVSGEHCALLRRTEITQMDYSKVFERCSTKDFVFLDPPYDCVFTDYGNLGEKDFSEQSQIKLAEDFRNLSAKSLTIIGKTELTKHLYKPYIKAEYSKKYAVNIRNRFKAESKHLIITNYTI